MAIVSQRRLAEAATVVLLALLVVGKALPTEAAPPEGGEGSTEALAVVVPPTEEEVNDLVSSKNAAIDAKDIGWWEKHLTDDHHLGLFKPEKKDGPVLQATNKEDTLKVVTEWFKDASPTTAPTDISVWGYVYPRVYAHGTIYTEAKAILIEMLLTIHKEGDVIKVSDTVVFAHTKETDEFDDPTEEEEKEFIKELFQAIDDSSTAVAEKSALDSIRVYIVDETYVQHYDNKQQAIKGMKEWLKQRGKNQKPTEYKFDSLPEGHTRASGVLYEKGEPVNFVHIAFLRKEKESGKIRVKCVLVLRNGIGPGNPMAGRRPAEDVKDSSNPSSPPQQ